MKTLIIAVLVMVVVPLWAYEYDSTVDPGVFFEKYTVIKFIPKDNVRGMSILKSETEPKYAPSFIIRIGNGMVRLVSYGYIEDNVFKHYILHGGCYIENQLLPNIRKAFRSILEEAINGKNQKAKETGKENSPEPGSYKQLDKQDRKSLV